jgi:hypothetical protein
MGFGRLGWRQPPPGGSLLLAPRFVLIAGELGAALPPDGAPPPAPKLPLLPPPPRLPHPPSPLTNTGAALLLGLLAMSGMYRIDSGVAHLTSSR